MGCILWETLPREIAMGLTALAMTRFFGSVRLPDKLKFEIKQGVLMHALMVYSALDSGI